MKPIKHRHEEGSRKHVLTWHKINGMAVVRCSESRCEINAFEAKRIRNRTPVTGKQS